MANISNVRMGQAQLTWKTQDLGHTLGGVKMIYTRNFKELNVDKYGNTAVDSVLTGTDLTITFKVAEPVVTMLQRVHPENDYQTGANGNRMGLGGDAGFSARAIAGLLTMHPSGKAASDQSEDVQIYLAAPVGNTELDYIVDGQRVYEVQMKAFVDEEFVNGRRLGHIGPVNVS